MPATATSELRVTLGYSPIGFAYEIVRPQLTLDDQPPMSVAWGTVVLPVTPGAHRLSCHFRWTAFEHAGQATVDVDVPDEHVVVLRYKAPSGFVFQAGRWTVDPATPRQDPPDGWYADTSGRHELRYYQAGAWTSHVSDAGVVTDDPLPSS
jgi:hypothetical protein